MFERFTEAAEKLATNVSRRAFMGRFGKGALAVTGALVALFASPGTALAGKKNCCYYGNSPNTAWLCSDGPCPQNYHGLALQSSFATGTCHACPPGSTV
jgi:hypothetical protein